MVLTQLGWRQFAFRRRTATALKAQARSRLAFGACAAGWVGGVRLPGGPLANLLLSLRMVPPKRVRNAVHGVAVLAASAMQWLGSSEGKANF